MYGSDVEQASAQQQGGWQPDATMTLSQIVGDAEGCVHHLCFVVGADALVTVIARSASVYELLVQLDAAGSIEASREATQITGSYTIYVVQSSLSALQDERGTVLLPGERHPFSHFSTDGLAELPAFDTERPLHCFRITPPALPDAAAASYMGEELSLTKVLRSADETCVELVFGEDESHASLSGFGAVGITHTLYDAAHTDEQPAECDELQLTYAKMIVLPVGSAARAPPAARPTAAARQPAPRPAVPSVPPRKTVAPAARPRTAKEGGATMESVSSIAQDPALMAQTLAATRRLLMKDILVPLRRVDVTEEQRATVRSSLANANANTGKMGNERLVVGPIRCQLCGESSRTLALYKEHVLLQHQNGCPLCSHKFQTKSRLLVHYPVCVRLKNEHVALRMKAYRERISGRSEADGEADRTHAAERDAHYTYGDAPPAKYAALATPNQRGVMRSSLITRRQFVAMKQSQQTPDGSPMFVPANANVVLVGDGTHPGAGPYEFSEAAEMSVVGVDASQGMLDPEAGDQKQQYVFVTSSGEQLVECGPLVPSGDVKLSSSFAGSARVSKGHNLEKQRGEYICKFCNRVCRNLIGLKSHITQGHREFYNKLLQYTLLKAQQIQLESGQAPAGAGSDAASQQLVAVVDQQTGQLISTFEMAEARLSVFSQDQIRAAFERVLNDVDIGSTQIMSDIKQEQLRSLAEYFGSPSELKELRAAQNASNSTEAMIMYRERIHQTADLLKHMPRQRSDCHRRGLWNVMDVERLMELIPNQLDDTAVEELPLRFKRQRFSVRNKPKIANQPVERDGDENAPLLADDQQNVSENANETTDAASGLAEADVIDTEGETNVKVSVAAENRSRSFGKAGIKFRAMPRDSTKTNTSADGSQQVGDAVGNDETLEVHVTDLTEDGTTLADPNALGGSVEKQRRPMPSHDDYVTRCRILDGRIECCECLQTFKHRGSLIKHRRRIHINKLRLICPHCSKAFAEKPAFEDHLNVHNNERPHVCEVCQEAFATRNQLWTHSMRADHSNGTFAQRSAKHCEECGLAFKNQFYLQVHQNASHAKPLIATAAGASGAATADDTVKPKPPMARRTAPPAARPHVEHMSNAHEITVDDLDVALSASAGDIKKAKRIARPTVDSHVEAPAQEESGGEQVMYRCGVCDALFGAYDDVIAHQDEMQRAQDAEAAGVPQDPQQVQYLCKICDLYFASECMANRHVRDHHP